MTDFDKIMENYLPPTNDDKVKHGTTDKAALMYFLAEILDRLDALERADAARRLEMFEKITEFHHNLSLRLEALEGGA
jgi:gamma-glutamylcysteine synthetase